MANEVRRCEVIEVIVTETWLQPEEVDGKTRPGRIVTEYRSLKGEPLAIKDPAQCELCGAFFCTSSHK